MHFVALTLALRPRNQRPLTINDSVYAHAAILNAITAGDEAIGHALHDMQRHKRISLAIVERPSSTALLRVSFMEQEGLTYAHLLMEQLAKDGTLRIDRSLCILSITAGAASDRQAKVW